MNIKKSNMFIKVIIIFFLSACENNSENIQEVPEDSDQDSVISSQDNCPYYPNSDQSDIDSDNIGDVCDNDIDNDSIINIDDNCPEIVNPLQLNFDGDYFGDECDTIQNANTSRLDHIEISSEYNYLNLNMLDPVVVSSAPTFNDAEPGIVFLGVDRDEMNARFVEWNYLENRNHENESVSLLSLDSGIYKYSNGVIIEANFQSINQLSGEKKLTFGEVNKVQFRAGFPKVPLLFTSKQTNHGRFSGLVKTIVVSNLNKEGFDFALMQQESDIDGGGYTEHGGYIALYIPEELNNNNIFIGDKEYFIEFFTTQLNSDWTAINSKFEAKLQEEQSKDSETQHINENISVLIIDDIPFIQATSLNEREPFTIRIRPIE